MDVEQAERFVQAAEADYRRCVDDYGKLVGMGMELQEEVDDVREARADVLAAQQVLELARNEARGAGRRDVEEEVACPNCGRLVGRANLFDSAARGVELCARCDAGATPEAGR